MDKGIRRIWVAPYGAIKKLLLFYWEFHLTDHDKILQCDPFFS